MTDSHKPPDRPRFSLRYVLLVMGLFALSFGMLKLASDERLGLFAEATGLRGALLAAGATLLAFTFFVTVRRLVVSRWVAVALAVGIVYASLVLIRVLNLR